MANGDGSGDRAVFGRSGYDAVTTRALAAAAETNVSSIKYHFGGKEELYRAALENVVAEIRALIDPVLMTLAKNVVRSGDDKAALRELAREFATNWCRAVLGDRKLQRRIPCIVRELLAPSASFEIIYDGFFRRFYRTHALVHVILGFVEGESIFWRQMGWKRYTPERIETILPAVADTFVAALG
jgi:AcrR family transcriptional regulator